MSSSIIVIFILLIDDIIAQKKAQISKELEMFNSTLYSYNITKLDYEDLVKRMENIKFNIFLKTSFSNLKRKSHELEENIDKTQKKLNKGDYNSNELINDISSLNEELKAFKTQYKKTNESYYDFENVKYYLKSIIKKIFIYLCIIIIIALIIIGIISLYVIKNQNRKYSELHEEISIKITDNKKNRQFMINNNDKNFDTFIKEKKKRDPKKNEILTSYPSAQSKDELHNKNIK